MDKEKPLWIQISPFLFGLTAFAVPLLSLDNSPVAEVWSLWPPFVAIFFALLTKKLILSLGMAVGVGSLLLSLSETQWVSVATGTFEKSFQFGFSSLVEPANLQILGFVFFVLAMIQVMEKAGGLRGIVYSLRGWIKSKKSCELVTAMLGVLVFIDDYANTMIVGSTMKNVSDRFRVSREKLAFLVDATSAPIAGVALVSTWVGYEVGLFGQVSETYGWAIDGYGLFLQALGFRFYCFFMLIFVFTNVFFGLDFGPMNKAKPVPLVEDSSEQGAHNLWCGIVPLGLLLFLVFFFFWIDGGGLEIEESIFSVSGWQKVLMNSENGTYYLLASSFIGWVVSNIMANILGKVTFVDLLKTLLLGLRSSGLPVVILILAWSMKTVCEDLKAGEYVVQLLGTQISHLWLPTLTFLIAALTAFATGTSWGTMAILIPTISPLVVQMSGGEFTPFTALCLASILDGAIMGDHCSPVSDTTIMSSISTGCDLVSHVRTQLPYVMIVGSVAVLFGYIPQALGASWLLSLGAATLFFVTLFFGVAKTRQWTVKK